MYLVGSHTDKMSIPAGMTEAVQNSTRHVATWVEEHNYQAYDPGDGDLSFLRYFTFDIHFLRRLLTGAVLRVPFHIRPLIGIRPHTSTKGMGYMGWGYVKMYASTGEENYRRRAEFCFDWLMENRSRELQALLLGEPLFIRNARRHHTRAHAHNRLEQPDRFGFPGSLRGIARAEVPGRRHECQ